MNAVMNGADTAWILTATALVLFMTLPGLALFYAGLVRSKNTLSVLMQCFAIACVASLVWLFIGYSIAFGDGGEGNKIWGGLGKVMAMGIGKESLHETLPETLFLMFQMTFAIITPALVVGAFVERIKFSAVILFTVLWLIFVYAPVTHWVWGGGWLADMGTLDFAGGIVVHATAGVAALVIAKMLGARMGFPNQMEPPHSPGITMIGAAMLWVGWFGFNAGSAVSAGQDAAMAMLVTHISAAVAALVWIMVDVSRGGKPSLVGIVTGMVAGLATITPASGFVGPVGALILGTIAGIVCNYSCNWIRSGLKIDDSLDVFAVHGVGGIMGSILIAFLASTYFGGAGVESIGGQLATQLIALAAVMVYTLVLTVIIVMIIKATTGLRVSAEEESEGLDMTYHGERENAI